MFVSSTFFVLGLPCVNKETHSQSLVGVTRTIVTDPSLCTSGTTLLSISCLLLISQASPSVVTCFPTAMNLGPCSWWLFFSPSDSWNPTTKLQVGFGRDLGREDVCFLYISCVDCKLSRFLPWSSLAGGRARERSLTQSVLIIIGLMTKESFWKRQGW